LSGKIAYRLLSIYQVDVDHWSTTYTLSGMVARRNKLYLSDKIWTPCYL